MGTHCRKWVYQLSPGRLVGVLCLVAIWCSAALCDGQSLVSKDIVDYATEILPYLREEAELLLNETLDLEADHTMYMKFHGYRSSGAFKMVQSVLGATPQAKQMSYGAFMQLKAMKILKAGLGLDKKQLDNLISRLPPFLEENRFGVYPDDTKFSGDVRMCPYPSRVYCDFSDQYRSHDGSCNNKNKPLWGTAFQPFARLIAADYADGIDTPRVARYGEALPSARLVSQMVHDDTDRPATAMTLMTMLLGQFVDHDMTRTAVSKLSDDKRGFGAISDVRCGSDGCMTGSGPFANCVPIPVPRGDPLFPNKRCLQFVRTLCVPESECRFGPRQQLNQITAYLDASNVYGSTKRQADTVRDLTDPDRGKLMMREHPENEMYKKMLPVWEDFSQSRLCKGATDTIKCFQAGDGRVNEHLGLMCLHTLFSREHNRIEAEFHRLNPHWSGDKLYEETRRLMGAMWQNIVYGEYLPTVLGPTVIRAYGLELQKHGYYDGYDPDVRADIANSFATAAFRYGHSQIQDMIKLKAGDYTTLQNIPLSSTFRSPAMLYNGQRPVADDVMRGFAGVRAQAVDSHVTMEVAGRLFSKDPPDGVGHDLPALNVQRGREHGIPGYVHWREWCGLSRAYTFLELEGIPENMVDVFAKLYRHVEDIDLFPAGLAETPAHGAVMGPTFACILANQFQRTRNGDRFWHENRNQPHPFTTDQLKEIRKVTLSKVICENSDTIHTIQPRALLRPFREVVEQLRNSGKTEEVQHFYEMYGGAWNERVPCDTIPSIDLTLWRDTVEYNYNVRYKKKKSSKTKTDISRNVNFSDPRDVLLLVPFPFYGR